MAAERPDNRYGAIGDGPHVAPGRGAQFTLEEETQLCQKVGSKIDVAKVLGGAITLTLGWILTANGVPRSDWRTQIAVVALLVSLGLYLVTVDAYDTLLMPPVLWRRWTWSFSAPLAIHHEMIRVWKGLFLPATSSLTVGLLLLVWAVMKQGSGTWAAPGWVLGAGLGAGALFVIVLRILSRPPMLGDHCSNRWEGKIPKVDSPGHERTRRELLLEYWELQQRQDG